MLYVEKEEQMGDRWYSYCHTNLGEKYQQWMVPVRLLGISPAEYVRLMVGTYHAEILYFPQRESQSHGGTLIRSWEKQADMRKWKNYINKVAREKGFQV